MGIILLDFLLNFIWLPIGVAKSYGFRSASFVFTETYNGTGTVSFSCQLTPNKY